MKIDLKEMVREITKIIQKHYTPRLLESEGELGLSAVCGFCGNGSISFCPCGELARLLENPPENVLIKTNPNE